MAQTALTLLDLASRRDSVTRREIESRAVTTVSAELASLSDETLMERVRGDDETAYRLLVERHVQRMHRLALRILGDHARAEDSVQEAFLRVWIKRADWRNEGARFSTWLHRVVFNCCLDVKRRRREEELKDDAEPADESDDAVATIHHEQIVARLRSAMSKLPEQQYFALIMYYHEGYTARELAELLDTTTNAVESLLKRGRKNLRGILNRMKVDARQVFDDS